MVFQNTYRGFFYRQIFVTPPLITSPTVSLVGKTGIVTGSNTGLGYHASSQLLSLGLSRLILAVRDTAKGEKAKSSLLATLDASVGSKNRPQIEVWAVDLTDYTSIIAFANRVRDTPNLHVNFAILNAGVARFNFEQLPNGNELTIQTNWLGTALLAITLRPVLQAQYTQAKKSTTNGHSPSPPVLSIVGSEVAQWAVFKERKIAASTPHTSVLSVLNDKKKFNPGDRYYTSKLLLALFFREFVDRLPSNNDVIVNLVNPGFCYGSELHRTLSGPLGAVFGGMKRAIGRSTEVGARTLVHGGAAAGKETHGCYLSDEKVAPWMDFVVSQKGEQAAHEMWGEMSQEFRGVVDVDAVMEQKGA
ncbi:MAG: hypothetical protein L6R39_003723 [Caloplaca ligustica]|nr:MAG: hypothetical protein L6R39_003723 [Caloplaca ligustica]